MPIFPTCPNFSVKKLLGTAASLCFFCLSAKAQVIFGSTINSIRTIDVGACNSSVLICNSPPLNDMCVAPSGIFYGINNLNLVSIDPNNGCTVAVVANLGFVATSLEFGNDGFVYAMGNQVRRVNPANGNVQNMGNLPAGWNGVGDLVYLETTNTFYGTINTPTGQKLAAIDVLNPAASAILSDCPINGLVAGAAVNHPTCPKLYWISTQTGIPVWEFRVLAGTWAQTCATLLPFGFGGADTQNDYDFAFSCACTTNAGNVTAQNFSLCGTAATVAVPFTGGQVLDSDDLLRYIIFEDLSDPEGSILLQSTSPTFSFDPNSMALGQTYFLGTVAGNELGGLVDLADPCLDFSNSFAQVVWWALPTVELSVADPEVCAGGCQTILANFTGSAPFNLTYTSPVGGQQTQSFAAAAGSFQICLPANFSAGDTAVVAVSLSDANCMCQ